MKILGYTIALALLLSCLSSHALWKDKEFEHYSIILEREPFGHSSGIDENEQSAPQTTLPPQQSFARNLRLTALWRIEGVGVRAGIMELQKKQNYTLGIGDSIDGIELVSADYEREKVMLRMGTEQAELAMDSGSAQPVSSAGGRNPSPAERLQQNSYIDRRRERREYKRPEPKEPKYSGEELRKRLQEVQMDAIRTGKPPLPIPLTPEMDRELVEEGVLPPLDE